MNHSSQYAPNKYYPIYTDNVRTDNEVTPPVIRFTDEVQLNVLPVNDPITNNDLITVDAFGTLYQSPISSIPVENIFDQQLNTDDRVKFENIELSNLIPLNPTIVSDIAANRYGQSAFTVDSFGSQEPQIQLISKIFPFPQGQALCFGCFYDTVGVLRASDQHCVLLYRPYQGTKSELILFMTSATQTIGTAVTSLTSRGIWEFGRTVISNNLLLLDVVQNDSLN